MCEESKLLDEMFLKIEGEQIYVILGTCYGKKKVLGVKVSASRIDSIIRLLFNKTYNYLKIYHQLRGNLVYIELKISLYGQIFFTNQKSMQNFMKMDVLN